MKWTALYDILYTLVLCFAFLGYLFAWRRAFSFSVQLPREYRPNRSLRHQGTNWWQFPAFLWFHRFVLCKQLCFFFTSPSSLPSHIPFTLYAI